MIVRSVLAACLFSAALATPLRADPVADSVTALSPAIQDVRVLGTWEKDGQKGAYRLIVARSGPEPTARIFVQWLARESDGTVKVQSSVDIQEMIELKRNVGNLVAEADADGLSIFLEMINPADANAAKESYELFISDDETYRFGPASN